MEEQSLALSFSNSLTEEVCGIAGEYAELGLDAMVEDDLFKDIPIVSTAVSVYRIGKSIRERHHVAKLIAFATDTPTNNAPTSPGPYVTAIAVIS